MKIGVVFPQTELGGDVAAVRAYGEAVGELGFTHLLAYDHVVGADPGVHEGWAGPYDITTTFHEPFVMFGYLAAVTDVELVTGIIILPQRQTALVAKQATEVDLLTQGNFRLGVGIGWNPVEYDALGKSFGDRGRRMSEQIALLRRLFTEPSVTFDGTYEQVEGAGLAPDAGAAADPDLGGRRLRRGLPPGRAGWPTAGSHRSVRGPTSTTRSRCWPRRRRAPGATRRPSAWRVGSASPPTIPTSWRGRPTAGARPGPAT